MSSNFLSDSYFSPRALGPGSGRGPRPRTNPLAVAAAVCAALGFVTAVGFVGAIIVGHIALVRIKRSNGREVGRRLAVAAVVVGWIPVGLVTLVFGLLVIVGLGTSLMH